MEFAKRQSLKKETRHEHCALGKLCPFPCSPPAGEEQAALPPALGHRAPWAVLRAPSRHQLSEPRGRPPPELREGTEAGTWDSGCVSSTRRSLGPGPRCPHWEMGAQELWRQLPRDQVPAGGQTMPGAQPAQSGQRAVLPLYPPEGIHLYKGVSSLPPAPPELGRCPLLDASLLVS